MKERLYFLGFVIVMGTLLFVGRGELPSSVILNWVLAFSATAAATVLIVSLYRVQQELKHSRKELSRKEAELDVAREVQKALFPSQFPENSGLNFSAICIPAQGISGDYYDIFTTSDGRTVFTVADVSGKGISAAILMANMQALLRTHVISTTSLPQVCERLNNHLFDFTEPARFTTCFLAQWFPDRKILEFVNAGHQVPVLDGFRQEPDFLKGGPPLGLFKGIEFDSGSVHLKKDDVLVLYSDGVTEAQNERDLEMGLERLREVITLNREFSPAEIQAKILERTKKWIGADPHDDVTLMIVKVEDKKTESASKAEVDGLRPISSSQ